MNFKYGIQAVTMGMTDEGIVLPTLIIMGPYETEKEMLGVLKSLEASREASVRMWTLAPIRIVSKEMFLERSRELGEATEQMFGKDSLTNPEDN